MDDDFLVVRNYGKLSAKFLSGTSMVIEKVELLSYFYFLLEQLLEFVLMHCVCNCHIDLRQIRQLRPVLLIVRAGNDKNKSFCLQNKLLCLNNCKHCHTIRRARITPRSYQRTLIKVFTSLKHEDV